MNLATTLSIYSGGPGSGCAGPNCGRKKGSGFVYHVTFTKNVNKIKKQGLIPGKQANWIQRGTGMPYGVGSVYTFENHDDAVRWAAKMDWEFNRGTGSGHVSILTIDKKGADWKEDTADPFHHGEGKWFKTTQTIPPSAIHGSEEVVGSMVRALVESDKQKYKPK